MRRGSNKTSVGSRAEAKSKPAKDKRVHDRYCTRGPAGGEAMSQTCDSKPMSGLLFSCSLSGRGRADLIGTDQGNLLARQSASDARPRCYTASCSAGSSTIARCRDKFARGGPERLRSVQHGHNGTQEQEPR